MHWSSRCIEGNGKIRIGIDSCVAVTVFPKTVDDDHPTLQTPGKAMSCRSVPGKLLPDLVARKGAGQTQWSLRYVSSVREPQSGWLAQSFDGGVGCTTWDTTCSSRRSDRAPRQKRSNSVTYSSFSALEQIDDMMVKITKAERPN